MREVTLHSSPDSMGGAKRFPNTRVPVSLFFLNLAEGVGIDRFCQGYPRVDPDDCRRVLAAARKYIEGRDEPPIEQEPERHIEDARPREQQRGQPAMQPVDVVVRANPDCGAEGRKRAGTDSGNWR